MERIMARIGVDVGGTNTDLVLECEKGIFYHKVPSTLKDQSIGVVQGVQQICRIADISPDEVDVIAHGTTVATNITIEHNGAEVGMLTTRGFRDILHIGRHKRPHNFSLHFDVPWQSRPLVKRRNRIAITERIMPPTGKIETPLAEDEVREACALFRKRGSLRSVWASCFPSSTMRMNAAPATSCWRKSPAPMSRSRPKWPMSFANTNAFPLWR
jgi:N-methylhydantoinase A